VTASPIPQEAAELEVRAVRRHRHLAPLRHPFVTAARRTEAVEYVVAQVELAGGVVGQGSAAETVAVTGEDARSILTALDGPPHPAGRRTVPVCLVLLVVSSFVSAPRKQG